MLKFIQSVFTSKPTMNTEQSAVNNTDAIEIELRIQTLEHQLMEDETNAETHKVLMLEYNKALKVFEKKPGFKNKIDDVFLKIDDLRNTTRKHL